MRSHMETELKNLEKALVVDKLHGQPTIENADQLKEQIAKAKAEGNLPIIVMVHTANEPFWTDSNAGAGNGEGGEACG